MEGQFRRLYLAHAFTLEVVPQGTPLKLIVDYEAEEEQLFDLPLIDQQLHIESTGVTRVLQSVEAEILGIFGT